MCVSDEDDIYFAFNKAGNIQVSATANFQIGGRMIINNVSCQLSVDKFRKAAAFAEVR